MATNSIAHFLSFTRSPPQIHHQQSSPNNRRLSLFYTPRGLLFSGGGNNGGGGFFGGGGGGEGDEKGRKKINRCGFFRPPDGEEVIFFDRLGDAVIRFPDRASYKKYIKASNWGLIKFILGCHLVMMLLRFLVDPPEKRMRKANEMKEGE